jgi:hypothetical protein
MSKWDANVQRLNAEANDPLFWDNLLHIARALQANDDRYIDDHNYLDQTLYAINICHATDDVGLLKSIVQKDYTLPNPIAWTSSVLQCKNPLFVDDGGRVHLSTCSVGMALTSDEQRVMETGTPLILKLPNEPVRYSQFMYRLPTNLFVTTMLSQ